MLVVLLLPALVMIYVSGLPELAHVSQVSQKPEPSYDADWSGDAPPETVLELSLGITQMNMEENRCNLSYYVAAGSHNPISAVIYVSGKQSGLSYTIPFESSDQTYELRSGSGGKVVKYPLWKHSHSLTISLHAQAPETSPYDYYVPPVIFIGINGTALLKRISLTYEMPQGYVASVEKPDHSTSRWTEIADWFPVFENYYQIKAIVVRNSAQREMLSTYLVSVSYFLLVTAIVSSLRISSVADRMKVYVGAAFALTGFLWGFRSAFPWGLTTWELILVLGVLLWGFSECFRAVVE
jgi:hypothetical protein